MDTLEEHRRFYAQLVVGSAGATDARLVQAFSEVPRENYLGPGPWQVYAGSRYLPTVTADARLLYQDVLIGLAPERGINNGQPSLHARCLATAAPAPGESVIHIGAGTGYYTAILATLVGHTGSVLAFEIEADLAAKASRNLVQFPQVRVEAASANEATLPACDLIYVSAGATHPPPAWLDALRTGGRLVFPLTPDEGFGVMLKITRVGTDRYRAHAFSRVAFIPCIGARDAATSASLTRALERRSLHEVRSLRRDSGPDSTAWCAGQGWWLSTADVHGSPER